MKKMIERKTVFFALFSLLLFASLSISIYNTFKYQEILEKLDKKLDKNGDGEVIGNPIGIPDPSLRIDLEQLENDIETVNQTIASVNQSVELVNSLVESNDSELDSIEVTVENQNNQLTAIDTALSSINDTSNALQVTQTSILNTLSGSTSSIESNITAISSLNATLSSSTSSIESNTTAISSLNAEFSSINAGIPNWGTYETKALLQDVPSGDYIDWDINQGRFTGAAAMLHIFGSVSLWAAGTYRVYVSVTVSSGVPTSFAIQLGNTTTELLPTRLIFPGSGVKEKAISFIISNPEDETFFKVVRDGAQPSDDSITDETYILVEKIA